MQKAFTILPTLTLVLLGCWSAQCESTNEALTFFIVSEQRIEGARFIDTTNLPKLGYAAYKPDLTVTNLADVFPAKRADFATMDDGKGNRTMVPAHAPPSLAVKLTTEDAKEFTALTKRATGRKLLIVLGDKTLAAPKVVAPIEGPSFEVAFTSQEELQKTQSVLKKLVR